MGLVQGESMAARFFHKLGAVAAGPHHLLQRRRRGAGRHLGGKVGMHVEFFAESRLILIWGSNSITSNLHFWTFAQQAKRDGAKLVCIDPRKHRDRRQVPPAHRAAARHRRRAGAGR